MSVLGSYGHLEGVFVPTGKVSFGGECFLRTALWKLQAMWRRKGVPAWLGAELAPRAHRSLPRAACAHKIWPRKLIRLLLLSYRASSFMANRVGFERRPEHPGLTGNRAFARGSQSVAAFECMA